MAALLNFATRLHEVAVPCHYPPVSGDGVERAVVSFRAVDTSANRRSVRLFDDTAVTFGRSPDCPVRFGHAPVQDIELPRVVGTFIVAGGRVMVERHRDRFRDSPQKALRVEVSDGPPELIVPGSVYSPPTAIFTLVVSGTYDWALDVAVRFDVPRSTSQGDIPTRAVPVELTDQERATLAAYAAPIIAGGFEPATHDQAAEAWGYSRATVRRVLEVLDDKFFAAGLWMPDIADSRVRVVTAARSNLLLADSTATLSSERTEP